MSFAKDIAKAVTGIGGAAAGGPRIAAPRFSGINTSGFSLSPQGTLTPTSPFINNAERALLSASGAARAGLQGAGASQRARIGALRGRINPLLDRTQGFFDQTAGLRGTLQQQLQELRPGFGRLTESRVGGVRAARGKAVGGIREAFNKRAILGSNFAQKEIAAQIADFAEVEDRIRAESFIQEQQAQQQIIDSIGNLLTQDRATIQTEASVMGVQLGLGEAEARTFANDIGAIQQELNVLQSRISRELQELGVAGNIINQVNAIASQVAIAEAKLRAVNAKAAGAGLISGAGGLGSLAKLAAPAIGTAIGGPAGGLAASAFVSGDFTNFGRILGGGTGTGSGIEA